MLRNSWTFEENERLRRYIVSGLSPLRVATLFGQSRATVKRQARIIGSPFPRNRIAHIKGQYEANLARLGHQR